MSYVNRGVLSLEEEEKALKRPKHVYYKNPDFMEIEREIRKEQDDEIERRRQLLREKTQTPSQKSFGKIQTSGIHRLHNKQSQSSIAISDQSSSSMTQPFYSVNKLKEMASGKEGASPAKH